ncbi:MAG: outer membrane lipoprotein-sorting protein [Pseudomonadales bacterium]|nr:outer membrane lipoprotein-sorting protein [Pseudomonadales bacterium]
MIENIFGQIIRFRYLTIVIGLLGIVSTASFLPTITRDTSADAFIPADNPARIYQNQIKEVFGLADPIIVALFQQGESGIFTPEALMLVEALTEKIQNLPNIDPERVVSLATEKNIVGTAEGMQVDYFFDDYPDNADAAAAMWQKIQNFPLYLGSLVARDGQATLIVAEVLDEQAAEQTYSSVRDLIDQTPLPQGLSIHVAGEAAVTGYLGTYIDADARRLNPVAGLIITIILFIAFRTLAGAMLPNIIVLATVIGTVGTMAAFGVSFFVITNAMPVVLIGIAVADSIHIFSAYYEAIRRQPAITSNQAVMTAMLELSRPITLTTLTTIAGFLGLYLSSVQPPMQYLGLFTAFGVAVAWLYSMTVLPACMSLLKVKPDLKPMVHPRVDLWSGTMLKLGHLVIHHPRKIVAVGMLLIAAGLTAALNIKVDDRRIETFASHEAVYIADQTINEHFDGTSVFDIVIETDAPDALFKPHNLKKMAAMQQFLEGHEMVGGTTSIVDYLKQMNRAINEGQASEYRLVDDKVLNAQLILLYSTSADPTDFEEEIDFNYQRANIRVNLKSGGYQELKPLVASFERYIDNEFNEPGLTATLSGRAMISYEWVGAVGDSHFTSVLVSVALVFAMAALVFRSTVAGLIALTPVVISILFVYAVMVLFNIDIGIGTSMFASVAIGLGVDFAIHTIDRIKVLYKTGAQSAEAMLALYPSTGRALVFNLLAIACGFGVLMSSEVVPLMRFGGIVALSVSTAFLFSLTFLPALVLLIKPKFVFAQNSQAVGTGSTIAGLLLMISVLGFCLPSKVEAAALSGGEIMDRVKAREEGAQLSRTLKMSLTDRRGNTRTRITRGFRKYFGDNKRSVLFYVEPANIKDTGFLTYDYADMASADDQWLYLPAAGKIRRISPANRGDYFLGTDFSYEDIKNENKPNKADYSHQRLGTELIDGEPTWVVEGKPINAKIAKELGYSRVLSYVDPQIWFIRKSVFWDTRGNRLKEISNQDIRQVNGIWTSHDIIAENFKTGHKTRFTFTEIDYQTPIDDSWFEPRRLRRGLR